VITTGGLFSLVILGLIGAFLLYRGFEIFSDFGCSFITGEVWNIGDPMDTSTAVLGIGAMLMGSVITSVIAIVIAVPCAIAVPRGSYSFCHLWHLGLCGVVANY